MKKLTALTSALALLMMACVQAPEPAELAGVWKIIYSSIEYPDTAYESTQFEYPAYKIFTAKHFSLSRQGENNAFSGHFGQYTYNDTSYTEHIEFSSYEPFNGQSFAFNSSMQGDKWTIDGVFEIEAGTVKMKETWQRVE